MRLLKENKILSILKESEVAADGLTLKEATEKIYNGYMDIDVSDSEIDMAVAFVYDVNEAIEDEYNKFISILAERTKIVKTVTSKWGDTLVCDFSSVFKPYNEELKEVFDMDNSEFDSDEAWAEAVVNLEPLISGNAGESTYKELNEILEGKSKEEPVNESNDSIFTSFRPSGQSEGLLGRLWFNIGDKTETVDLFYVDGEYRLVYGMIIPGYVKEFIDSYGYDKLLQEAIAYVEKNKGMNEAVEEDKLIDGDMTIKELNDTANWIYKNCNRPEEWEKFTDNELIELAKLCQITEEHPWGKAYDDEVFDEMDRRGLSLSKNESASLKEAKEEKISSNDIFDGVNLEFTDGGKTYYLYATWDSNFDIDEEIEAGNVPEDANSEDWGGIYFDVFDSTGEEVNGGLLVTDKDEFSVSELGSELLDLCGLAGENFKKVAEVPRKEEPKKEKATGTITVNDLDNEGNNVIFRGEVDGEDIRMLVNFFINSNGELEYTIYKDFGGEELDGGVMEASEGDTWSSIEDVAKEIVDFQGIKKTNSFIKCDNGSSEDALVQYGFLNESLKESAKREDGPINPDDKDYYNGKLWKVGLYSGAGYELTMFKVYAGHEEEALCLVVAECERKEYFGLITSYEDLEKEYENSDEFEWFKQEKPSSDFFEFLETDLNYIYVDATMEGASKPYFVHGENLVVEEISDNDDSDKGSMNESEDRVYYKNGEFIEPKWFKNKKLYNEFKEYVDSMLQGGRAIDDPEYVNSLTPEEYESLLVDTWMKDQELINMFEEHLDEEDLKEGVKENSPIGKTFICKKSVHHPNLGDLVRRGEIVNIKSYSPKAKAYIADTEAGVYVTEETLKNNFEEYNGPIFGAVTADGKVVIKFDNEEEALDYADERNEWDEDQLEVKQLNEEVTFSKPESATNSTNKQSAKVRDVLDYELEDDDTETGGVSFNGETVRDFIADPDMGVKDTDSVDSLNKVLTTCGIKPICEGYAESKYRGDDYWELSDYYERGSIDKEELASRLFDLYSDYNGARGAYIEITGETDMPKVDGDTDEIKEVEAKELSDLVNKWDEDHKSIPRGRWIAKEGKKFVAIDNRTEDCWTEEFDSKEQAMSWLNDEFEMSDLNEAVVEDKNAYYYEIPISYGPGDVSNINVVVTNGKTSGYSYEEIQKALNGVTIYGNDLSGEEYMMDIKLSDGKWLEYKGKEGTDRYSKYVFTVIKSYKESAEDGTHEVNYLINDGEYAISILERLTGGEADFLVKAKDGKGNSGILSGYDQVEGYEFTEDDEPFYSEGMYSEEDVIDLIHKFKPDLEVTKVSRILKLSDTYTEIDVPKGSISATPSIAKEINSKSAGKIKHVRKAD